MGIFLSVSLSFLKSTCVSVSILDSLGVCCVSWGVSGCLKVMEYPRVSQIVLETQIVL